MDNKISGSTVTMQVFASQWQNGKREIKLAGLPVKVAVDPRYSNNKISLRLVNYIRTKYAELVEKSENGEYDEFETLKLILKYRDLDIDLEFEVCLTSGEHLGEVLENESDIQLGKNEITEARLEMRRRSFLTSRYGELNPVFRGRGFKVDPDFCFVLMPFGEQWSDRIWGRHIKPTVESIGMRCKRADDIYSTNVITEDIWAGINQACVVIADLTGRNPNVFYELGIAHVVGVPVILLTQEHEIPAFDTAHWRQIRYEDNSEGCEKLEKSLRTTLENIAGTIQFP